MSLNGLSKSFIVWWYVMGTQPLKLLDKYGQKDRNLWKNKKNNNRTLWKIHFWQEQLIDWTFFLNSTIFYLQKQSIKLKNAFMWFLCKSQIKTYK